MFLLSYAQMTLNRSLMVLCRTLNMQEKFQINSIKICLKDSDFLNIRILKD